MRPNNPNKRLRGRSRNKNSNPLSRSYESNGPDVKIRGSALQVADKYAQLARDAQSAGDRVIAENYFQHAEHYYRIVAAAYEQSGQQQPREQRENERNGRYEGNGNRNDQPYVNGHDGVEDDDEGVRRAIRVNGNQHNDDRDDDESERPEPQPRSSRRGRRNDRAEASDNRDEGEDEGEAETVSTRPTGNGHAAETDTDDVQPAEPAREEATAEPASPPVQDAKADSAGETDAAGEDAPAEEAPKPKRRARAPRTRSTTTRSRRTASNNDSSGESTPEASESTS